MQWISTGTNFPVYFDAIAQATLLNEPRLIQRGRSLPNLRNNTHSEDYRRGKRPTYFSVDNN